jgi:hypothetical protein
MDFVMTDLRFVVRGVVLHPYTFRPKPRDPELSPFPKLRPFEGWKSVAVVGVVRERRPSLAPVY